MTDNNHDPKEVGLYEKIAERTAELLDEGRKTFDEALKKAREEAAKAGDYSREQIDKASEYVKRDLAELGRQADKASGKRPGSSSRTARHQDSEECRQRDKRDQQARKIVRQRVEQQQPG